MQGDVSRTGGTEAGVLPKYKNDIKKILIWLNSINTKWFPTLNKLK